MIINYYYEVCYQLRRNMSLMSCIAVCIVLFTSNVSNNKVIRLDYHLNKFVQMQTCYCYSN